MNKKVLLKLPYEIKCDSDYLSAFTRCLNQYKKWSEEFLSEEQGYTQFFSVEEKDRIKKAIARDGGIIKNCINLYYSGKIVQASEILVPDPVNKV